MKIPGRRRQLQKGVTFIEVLVAGVLLSIGLMSLVQIWLFSFRVTINTDQQVIAYNLGRQALERVKMAGYDSQPEGSATLYYNGNQVLVSAGDPARQFRVSTAVNSNQPWPSTSALRTVIVAVQLVETGATLYQTQTYLVRAGI